jgi:hypothetical protein
MATLYPKLPEPVSLAAGVVLHVPEEDREYIDAMLLPLDTIQCLFAIASRKP